MIQKRFIAVPLLLLACTFLIGGQILLTPEWRSPIYAWITEKVDWNPALFSHDYGIDAPVILLMYIGAAIVAVLITKSQISFEDLSAPETRSLQSLNTSTSSRWKLAFRVLLLFWLGCAGLCIFQTLTHGNSSLWAWCASLILFISAGYAWDRSRSMKPRVLTPLIFTGAALSAMTAVGYFFIDDTTNAIIALSIAAALLIALGWLRSWLTEREHRFDDLCMLGFSVCAFLIFSHDILSWRWGFIGDEFPFYLMAREIFHRATSDNLLSPLGVYSTHPMLGSFWQSLPMHFFGDSVYAWRVSNVYFCALAAPPLYLLVKHLYQRKIAVLCCAFYCTSHFVFVFSKIGSQNTQVLFFLTWILFCTAYSTARGSIFFTTLTAAGVGLSFFSFGTARLFSLFIPIWYFIATPGLPWKEKIGRVGLISACSFLIALPTFTSSYALNIQIAHTAIGHEIYHTTAEKIGYVLKAIPISFFQFLNSKVASHWIFGPHVDAIVGALAVLGMVCAFMLGKKHRSKFTALFLFHFLLIVLISASSRYGSPPNTRAFIFAVPYSFFGAMGFYVLFTFCFQLFRVSTVRRKYLWIALSSVTAVSVALFNHWIAYERGQSGHRWPQYIFKIGEELRDKAFTQIYFFTKDEKDFNDLRRLMQFYGIPQPRFIHDREDGTIEESVCADGEKRAVALFWIGIPHAAQRADALTKCWPGSTRIPLPEKNGEFHGFIVRTRLTEADYQNAENTSE